MYFILALAAGAWMAAPGSLGKSAASFDLFPVYIHLLVEGWITLLIIGVVFWMFPKFSRESPRGSEALGWVSYVLLNSGLVLRLFAEPANAAAPRSWWGVLLAVSAFLQWLGGVAFVLNTWGRVKVK